MRQQLLLPTAVLSAVLLAGCGGATTSGAGTPTAPDPGPVETLPTSAPSTEGGEATAAPAPDGTVFGFDATAAAPGTWAAGEAGTVTFSVENNVLVLGAVEPAAGWTVTETTEQPDEIEVDFRNGPTEVEIEIEISSAGSLEIEIDTDIDPAEPGTYPIGDAGEVTFAFTDGALQLVDLTVADDWQVTAQSETPTEIDVDLVRGAADWEVEIDIDDGQPEVELDFEVVTQL